MSPLKRTVLVEEDRRIRGGGGGRDMAGIERREIRRSEAAEGDVGIYWKPVDKKRGVT